jgi:hypothetical protein
MKITTFVLDSALLDFQDTLRKFCERYWTLKRKSQISTDNQTNRWYARTDGLIIIEYGNSKNLNVSSLNSIVECQSSTLLYKSK